MNAIECVNCGKKHTAEPVCYHCGSKEFREQPQDSSPLDDMVSCKPIVKQTHPVMVGRLKNGRIFVQANGAKVELGGELVRDLVSSLLLIASN